MSNPFKISSGAAFPEGHPFRAHSAAASVGVVPAPVIAAREVGELGRVSRPRILSAALASSVLTGGEVPASPKEMCSKRGRTLFDSSKPDSDMAEEDLDEGSESEDEAMKPLTQTRASVVSVTREGYAASADTTRDSLRRRLFSPALTRDDVSLVETPVDPSPAAGGAGVSSSAVPFHMRFIVSPPPSSGSRGPGGRGGTPSTAAPAAQPSQVRIAPLRAATEAVDELNELFGKVSL